jgi:hypothetical protein
MPRGLFLLAAVRAIGYTQVVMLNDEIGNPCTVLLHYTVCTRNLMN